MALAQSDTDIGRRRPIRSSWQTFVVTVLG